MLIEAAPNRGQPHRINQTIACHPLSHEFGALALAGCPLRSDVLYDNLSFLSYRVSTASREVVRGKFNAAWQARSSTVSFGVTRAGVPLRPEEQL